VFVGMGRGMGIYTWGLPMSFPINHGVLGFDSVATYFVGA